MPELPEVETVVRGLKGKIVGKKIKEVIIRRYDLRYPISDNLVQILQDSLIVDIKRRAKYILIQLDNGHSIMGHLGMSGRMVLSTSEPNIEKHDHVIIVFKDGMYLIFNDTRRFGFLLLIPTHDLMQHPMLARLGVEPLETMFDAAYLYTHTRDRVTPIKHWLMDNAHVVGIGNIYACESLFYAGILPTRPAASITPQQSKKLVTSIKHVLHQALDAGGSSLKDYVQASGAAGYFQHAFKVYGREGEVCYTCHQQIMRIRQGGRSSFYCKGCQS